MRKLKTKKNVKVYINAETDSLVDIPPFHKMTEYLKKRYKKDFDILILYFLYNDLTNKVEKIINNEKMLSPSHVKMFNDIYGLSKRCLYHVKYTSPQTTNTIEYYTDRFTEDSIFRLLLPALINIEEEVIYKYIKHVGIESSGITEDVIAWMYILSGYNLAIKKQLDKCSLIGVESANKNGYLYSNMTELEDITDAFIDEIDIMKNDANDRRDDK